VAKSHISKAKIKAKIYADQDTNTKTFKIGDKVLLQDETLRRGRSKKLETPWTGPYRDTEKLSDVNYCKTTRILWAKLPINAPLNTIQDPSSL